MFPSAAQFSTYRTERLKEFLENQTCLHEEAVEILIKEQYNGRSFLTLTDREMKELGLKMGVKSAIKSIIEDIKKSPGEEEGQEEEQADGQEGQEHVEEQEQEQEQKMATDLTDPVDPEAQPSSTPRKNLKRPASEEEPEHTPERELKAKKIKAEVPRLVLSDGTMEKWQTLLLSGQAEAVDLEAHVLVPSLSFAKIKCPFAGCSKRFGKGNTQYLLDHVLTTHICFKRFTCSVCSCNLFSLNSVQRHYQRVHRTPQEEVEGIMAEATAKLNADLGAYRASQAGEQTAAEQEKGKERAPPAADALVPAHGTYATAVTITFQNAPTFNEVQQVFFECPDPGVSFPIIAEIQEGYLKVTFPERAELNECKVAQFLIAVEGVDHKLLSFLWIQPALFETLEHRDEAPPGGEENNKRGEILSTLTEEEKCLLALHYPFLVAESGALKEIGSEE